MTKPLKKNPDKEYTMDFLHLGLEQAATARDALPWHFNQACKGFNHQTKLTSEWDYASENLYKDVLK